MNKDKWSEAAGSLAWTSAGKRMFITSKLYTEFK